jgi:hypothetical protein
MYVLNINVLILDISSFKIYVFAIEYQSVYFRLLKFIVLLTAAFLRWRKIHLFYSSEYSQE